jgi:hypothetical protein
VLAMNGKAARVQVAIFEYTGQCRKGTLLLGNVTP